MGEPVLISDAELIDRVVKAMLEYNDKLREKVTKSRHDRRLRNTKLLLKHYNHFKDHIEKAVYKGNAIDFLDDMDNLDELIYINSIKESVSRTNIIMSHVKMMLELYQTYCDKKGALEQRKIRVLNSYYFDDKTLLDISVVECVDERTCLRDLRAAENKLSALIFGIDSIREMSDSCLDSV